jgi:hypothetical protein
MSAVRYGRFFLRLKCSERWPDLAVQVHMAKNESGLLRPQSAIPDRAAARRG